jgi:hypothetical protein
MGASLPLEVTLYFNGFYSALVFIITLLMFIFKAVVLPYPPNVLGLEVAFVFLYGIVEWVRLRQGALLRARAMRGFFLALGLRARPRPLAITAPLRAPRPTLPSPRCPPRAASRGNRLESLGPLLFSLCLSAPVVIFHVYYLQLQTYVLRLDAVVQGIALAFVGAEALLQARAACAFWGQAA